MPSAAGSAARPLRAGPAGATISSGIAMSISSSSMVGSSGIDGPRSSDAERAVSFFLISLMMSFDGLMDGSSPAAPTSLIAARSSSVSSSIDGPAGSSCPIEGTAVSSSPAPMSNSGISDSRASGIAFSSKDISERSGISASGSLPRLTVSAGSCPVSASRSSGAPRSDTAGSSRMSGSIVSSSSMTAGLSNRIGSRARSPPLPTKVSRGALSWWSIDSGSSDVRLSSSPSASSSSAAAAAGFSSSGSSGNSGAGSTASADTSGYSSATSWMRPVMSSTGVGGSSRGSSLPGFSSRRFRSTAGSSRSSGSPSKDSGAAWKSSAIVSSGTSGFSSTATAVSAGAAVSFTEMILRPLLPTRSTMRSIS